MLSVLVAQLVGSFEGFRQEEGIGKEKKDEMFFFLSQWFAPFLDSLHSSSLSHSLCEFLSGSLTFSSPIIPPPSCQHTLWPADPVAI